MRRGARAISSFLGWAALLVEGAWAASRLATDRWVWTQYVWWTPTIAFLGACAGLILAAWVMRRMGRRPRDRARRTRWRAHLVAPVAGWVLIVAFMVGVEWRIYRVAAARDEDGFRVVYWNASWPAMEGFAGRVAAPAPDVAIVANAPFDADDAAVRERFGPGADSLRIGRTAVYARRPILRYGSASPGFEAVPAGHSPDSGYIDTGGAAWIEVAVPGPDGEEVGGTARSIIIWTIDMPSDVRMSRWEAGGQAAEAIRTWSGPTMVRGPDGRWVRTGAVTGEGGQEARPSVGFPAPDVVVGDFNAPRGSASVRRIVGTLRDAFAAAGTGYSATYPRTRPIWHIDLAFVGERWRTLAYRVLDPGKGTHRMQVLEIAPRSATQQ